MDVYGGLGRSEEKYLDGGGGVFGQGWAVLYFWNHFLCYREEIAYWTCRVSYFCDAWQHVSLHYCLLLCFVSSV